MPLIIKDKNEGKKTPHLSLTHMALQGGAANGRNLSLLMKNKENLSEDIIKALSAIGIDLQEVNKAAFYSQMQTLLTTAVRAKFADDDGWLYVEDFNDSVVIFCTDGGLYSAKYSIENGIVILDDLANPMQRLITFVEADGKMLLSEDAEDKLEEGVYSLVTKALQNENTVEHLTKMFEKTKHEVETLKEEIQKAVEAAEAVLKAQLASKQEELEKALAEAEELKKAQREAVEKARKEKLVAVVGDVEAEELFKAIGGLEEQAFAAVFASLEKKAAAEQKELEKEVGVDGGVAPDQDDELALVGKLIEKSKKKK